jgi:hypothetical protein
LQGTVVRACRAKWWIDYDDARKRRDYATKGRAVFVMVVKLLGFGSCWRAPPFNTSE